MSDYDSEEGFGSYSYGEGEGGWSGGGGGGEAYHNDSRFPLLAGDLLLPAAAMATGAVAGAAAGQCEQSINN